MIAESLTALCTQPGVMPGEIVVADSSRDGTPRIVQAFPGVRLLHFDEPLTIPELRGRTLSASEGRIVAILDPFAIVSEHWRLEVLAAHERYPHPVIGGAVTLHDACRTSLLAWASYINECGMFFPPIERGAATILPGCNVSYKRAALFAGDTPRFPVFWKTFVNWELQASGWPLWLVPEIEVRLRKPIPFGDFLASRFDHGRCFAGMHAGSGGGGLDARRMPRLRSSCHCFSYGAGAACAGGRGIIGTSSWPRSRSRCCCSASGR